MELSASTIAAIAAAVVDELERRATTGAAQAAERRARDLEQKAAARRVAIEAQTVDPARHVFVDRGHGFERAEFGGHVTRDPKTRACLADGLTLARVKYEHVGERTGTNPDGSAYSVRCYRRRVSRR